MRLKTESGEITLPADFSFSIDQKSPFFSNEGTQSIPVTLPDNQINNKVLNYMSRPGHHKQRKRKLAATIETSLLTKSGTLVIENVQKGVGTVAAIMLNESDFYTKIKDVTLPEVFANITRNFSSIETLYNHLFSCMTGETTDDFTMFPVACNLSGEKYSLLNGPDTRSTQDPWPLRWKARRVAYDDQAVNVPDGYGITPFLWFHRVLDILFAEYGYTVRNNPFRQDSFLSKIVLINNTADSICLGAIFYGDLVPSCSVADLIKFLEVKFLCFCFISPESKTVDIIPLKDAIASAPDIDLTPKIDGDERYIFSDPQEVDIKYNTSLEGAAPALETIFDLANKYSHIASLNEAEFRNNAWKYNLIFRQSTGQYYEVLRKPGTSQIKINKLGSNIFRHYTKRLQAKEYSPIDETPPMVELKMGVNGSKEAIIICPYIGNTRHLNTSYKEKKDNTELKIMIALAAGISDNDANIDAKYYIGTTQRYNNMGNVCFTHDLTPQSTYKLFFKGWNELIMNSGIAVEGKIDYSAGDILSLNLDKPKIMRGQPVLLQELSYNVGERVTNIMSKFILLKKLTPEIEDVEVSFSTQLYTWEYQSNFGDLVSEFDTQEWDNYTWDYVGDDAPSKNSFEYLPPPTEGQYISGETYYSQQNTIKITAYKLYNPTPFVFEKTLISGFKAVLI